MSKLICRLLVVLAFGWAGSASAGLMPPVAVNGQEWLQPADFLDLTWTEVYAVCDDDTLGLCNGSLGGNDITGWTWANVDDVNNLFNSYIGTPVLSGPSSEYMVLPPGTFTPAFFNDFNYTAILSGTRFDVNGWTRDSGPFPPFAYTGLISKTSLADFAFTRSRQMELNSERIGAWFYRENRPEVPTPATLPLLGLGLAALCFNRRQRITS